MDVRTAERMLRAAQVVAATLDADLVLEHILEEACGLLRARAAVVWALEEDGAAGRFRARGFAEAERRRIESRLLHWGDHPSAEALVEEAGVARVTLVAGGRAAGVLVVSCPGGRPLSARRRECLRRFAPLAAAALVRAAEHERTRRALATVSESQAMLGAVIQHASDGILVLDDHLRVMLANRAAETLTGHPAGTLLGRQCFDFLRCYCGGAQPVCEERCPLNPLLSLRREPAPPAELRLDTPAGHRWVGVSWATIASGRGGRPLTVLVLRDITAAKEADQMKSAIISLVSHELRTPLTSIRMLSELLVEHAFDPREARPLLSDIAAESRRLSRLVEQVLEVARLEGGHVAFTPRPVDLPPLLAAAVELLRPHAPGHTFHLERAKNLPAVLADPDRVRQILD
ncbi:MAG TPA: histidine kinase dimerization/phospho-acceptor domain-containing protein, partial [Chloroflexota bacterium]|nr:histidine kinase dimerization/phospho-acceptor domain-containing protein [Chloroflexota bacterium]